jgi:thiopeptide-type bacteriocin biosynthesis protein
MNSPELYRHLDAALLRVTAYQPAIPAWPSAAGEHACEPWRAWIHAVWSDPRVASAVRIASPALAAGIDGQPAKCPSRRGRERDMALSLARYLVRMRGRATPFGLFAGVAPLRFGRETAVSWAADGHVQARADATWLAGVIARLEGIPELRDRLPAVASNLAFVRGDRLVVPWQPPASGSPQTAELSIRYTSAVQRVLAAAATPQPLGELQRIVSAAFPDSARDSAALLAQLVRHGVLITGLRPSSTDTDGLARILSQLSGIGAPALPAVVPVAESLHAIHARLRGMTDPGQLTAPAIECVSRLMRGVAPAPGAPLMVNLRSGAVVTLPGAVATEAAAAAAALARLSPDRAGDPAWRAYHDRFIDRYGIGALVPLAELTDPVSGLGFPDHFREPPGEETRRPVSERDRRLLALAQQAALDKAREVVLDDEQIETIAGDPGGRSQWAPHAEICVDVRAPSRSALDAGAFLLGVSGVGRSAGVMSGRFAALLPAADQKRMREAYRTLPPGTCGGILAQLSFPPVTGHLENVARTPVVLPAVISLAEHAHEGCETIPLADLAVTADADGLYVVTLSRRQVIEPVRVNAVAPPGMPRLARLLAGLPQTRRTGLQPFSWGTADCLPFLPRIRYRQTILAPARWRLPARGLPGGQAPMPAWLAAFGQLRHQLALPAQVCTGTGDRRLKLDLDDPMDLALLRAHLDSDPDAAVSEGPAAADYGWIDGRAHEIVIPVASTVPPAPAPRIAATARPVARNRDGHLPGSRVLYARLYTSPQVIDTILTGHLGELLAAWGDAPPWWFVRYCDPRPHLRLRLHLPGPGGYGDAAGKIGLWAAALRRQGLVSELSLDTYRPETARYGAGDALTAAEALFAADSAAAIVQLAAQDATSQRALAAVSLADLAAAVTGSWQAGMRWLTGHGPAQHQPAGDRAVIRHAVAMAGSGERIRLDGIPEATRITAAWQARRRAAARYADLIAAPGGHADPDSAIMALLHMHHNRIHGIWPDCEAQCRQAARAVALAWTARHAATHDRKP